ncbi:hypothetical protein HKX48_005455 [Thoreauomyces humboldtii]|nr:hypothetical protein HKX48_005455 [Thoreauomyces humboldtii]
MKDVAEGLAHLHNVIAAQVGEPFAPARLPADDDDSIVPSSLLTSLVRDTLARATRFVSVMSDERQTQHSRAVDASKQFAIMEDRISLLEMVSESTQNEANALQLRLEKETAARIKLEQIVEGLVAAEESRAVARAVDQALQGSEKFMCHGSVGGLVG